MISIYSLSCNENFNESNIITSPEMVPVNPSSQSHAHNRICAMGLSGGRWPGRHTPPAPPAAAAARQRPARVGPRPRTAADGCGRATACSAATEKPQRHRFGGVAGAVVVARSGRGVDPTGHGPRLWPRSLRARRAPARSTAVRTSLQSRWPHRPSRPGTRGRPRRAPSEVAIGLSSSPPRPCANSSRPA